MFKSLRVENVQSPIIPIVGQLIKSNPGTISLGQGIVRYPPPREALEHVDKFLAYPENHKYHAVQGIAPLLEKIREKIELENGIILEPQGGFDRQTGCLCVTAGANMAFMNAILAVCDPGDEVIILTPYYFNHEMAIRIADCRPVTVSTDDNYQPIIEAIENTVTDRTRAVVTISPNNPTGAVYSESTLRRINDLCRDRGVYHISDEAYEYFTWDDAKHFSPGSIAGANSHTISLFSLSKAYGFASWRIGYMVFGSHLESAIKKIQDTILICPPVISQYAALGALHAGSSYCRKKTNELARVRDIVQDELDSLKDFCTVSPGDGAFYYLLKVMTDLSPMELTKELISRFKVAVIPGQTFGLDDGCYLRISYGPLDTETASEGIGRLVKGLRSIVG